MQFASGGTGTSSHIGCVLLNQTIGVDIPHIPYRGGGPAMADLVAGRVDYICNIASTVGPGARGQAGQGDRGAHPRALADPADLPTAHEQGLKISTPIPGTPCSSPRARRRRW